MKNWYCIFTKPGIEDHVAQRLINVPDIVVFNPQVKRKKYIRGKMQEVVEELFPCYIFLCFNPVKHAHMIRYTRGVRKIVGDMTGNPFTVDESIISSIQSRIENGYVLIDAPELHKGDKVLVHEGPFKGLLGVFHQELKARDRVMILLNTIAYQASIEIEKGVLVKA